MLYIPHGLLICSIVVSDCPFHVSLCRHTSFSSFFITFSALSHICLLLLSLGVVHRLYYTVSVCIIHYLH